MTDLRTRRTKLTLETACVERGRQIIAEVTPYSLVMREKGRRTRYEVDFNSILWLAIKKQAAADRAEKLAKKKGRR